MINDDKGGTLGNVYNPKIETTFDPRQDCSGCCGTQISDPYNDRKDIDKIFHCGMGGLGTHKTGEGDVWHALEEKSGSLSIRNNDFVMSSV